MMYNDQKRRFPSQTSPSTSSLVYSHCIAGKIESIFKCSFCATAIRESFTLCKPRSMAIRIPRPAKFHNPPSEFFWSEGHFKNKQSQRSANDPKDEGKKRSPHTSPNSAHESRSSPAAISLEGSLISGIASVQAASMYSCGLRAGAGANLDLVPRAISTGSIDAVKIKVLGVLS